MISEVPVDFSLVPEDAPQAAERDERHLLFFSRLKSHAGSRGNIETHAPRLFAIELPGRDSLRRNDNGCRPESGRSPVWRTSKIASRAPLVGNDRVRMKANIRLES